MLLAGSAGAAAPGASSSIGGSTGTSIAAAGSEQDAAVAELAEPNGPPVVGYSLAEDDEELHLPSFPSRPGKQICDFFMKTGHCKYGIECVFDHPSEFAVQLTKQGLPYRAGQPICTFYQKTQQCKFGPSCKFHHPKLLPIYAGSAIQQHH
jgi:serine/threonine-protein kinase/endoribonuclease IRE1